ncbi:MAG: ROK family protein [Actinomycetes bacterium]
MGSRTVLEASATAGALLKTIREEPLATRAALSDRTGLSRAALSQRLDLLVAHGLVVTDGRARSTGGRPPAQFHFNSRAGLVLGIDVGISATRVGLANLSGEVLADCSGDLSVEDGPETVLRWVAQRTDALLAELGTDAAALWGVGVGVPGPVEFNAGRVVDPPFMPGWDRFPIREWFTERYGCPAVVDKDANIMALGEYLTAWRHLRHVLFVKAGTGIGCGIVADGRVYRGANGAAGDIGHIQLQGHGDPACRCGNSGCVEAMAGGWAIVRDLKKSGAAVKTAHDVAVLAQARDHEALNAIRRAGRLLGEALADAVNFFNPSVVIVGGSIGLAHGEFLAGVREVVYQRSLPLATQDLQIVPSPLGDRAGIIGAAHLIGEIILDPLAVDQRLTAAEGTVIA